MTSLIPEFERAVSLVNRINRTARDLGLVSADQDLVTSVVFTPTPENHIVSIEMGDDFLDLDSFARLATSLEKLADRVPAPGDPVPGSGQGSFDLDDA